MTLYIIIRCFS